MEQRNDLNSLSSNNDKARDPATLSFLEAHFLVRGAKAGGRRQ